MSTNTLLEFPTTGKESSHPIEDELLSHVNGQDVVSLDTLIMLLPQYSWNQIFQAVDHLARTGRIVLRRHHFEYTLFSVHYAA